VSSPEATSPAGRVLALDYGQVHCGCAISDPSGTIASPLEAIGHPASDAGLEQIATLVSRHDVATVVVGLPVGLSGTEGEQAAETRRFVERLRAALPVPVETYDERFTSKLARRTEGRSSEHSRAAAHLLSQYLAAGARET
jgi:putative Holliday junction resolvase